MCKKHILNVQTQHPIGKCIISKLTCTLVMPTDQCKAGELKCALAIFKNIYKCEARDINIQFQHSGSKHHFLGKQVATWHHEELIRPIGGHIKQSSMKQAAINKQQQVR